MSYSISYTVGAQTKLEAIDKACSLLRTNVRLRGVNDASEVLPGSGIWRVSLNVTEDL